MNAFLESLRNRPLVTGVAMPVAGSVCVAWVSQTSNLVVWFLAATLAGIAVAATEISRRARLVPLPARRRAQSLPM